MKINTYKNCLVAYTDGWSGWQNNFDVEREDSLRLFPYSVIIEGDLLEIDLAIERCIKLAGQPDVTSEIVYFKNSAGAFEEVHKSENGNWKSFFYGKIDYDYGFCEFFFKNEEESNMFKDIIPKLYVEVNGKKWRTDGKDKIINLN